MAVAAIGAVVVFTDAADGDAADGDAAALTAVALKVADADSMDAAASQDADLDSPDEAASARAAVSPADRLAVDSAAIAVATSTVAVAADSMAVEAAGSTVGAVVDSTAVVEATVAATGNWPRFFGWEIERLAAFSASRFSLLRAIRRVLIKSSVPREAEGGKRRFRASRLESGSLLS
jgi:hypothetical protein